MRLSSSNHYGTMQPELCRREKLYLSPCLLIHIKVHRSKRLNSSPNITYAEKIISYAARASSSTCCGVLDWLFSLSKKMSAPSSLIRMVSYSSTVKTIGVLFSVPSAERNSKAFGKGHMSTIFLTYALYKSPYRIIHFHYFLILIHALAHSCLL